MLFAKWQTQHCLYVILLIFLHVHRAETEYRDRRTNAELIGEVEPYDDEDMEWCIRNNFVPDSFLSADDLSTGIC